MTHRGDRVHVRVSWYPVVGDSRMPWARLMAWIPACRFEVALLKGCAWG